MTADISANAMSEGCVRVEITNCDGDDFINYLWSVTATLGEHRLTWKIPDRLLSRPEVTAAVSEEIVNELQFYIDRIIPIKNRFRRAG